jgi:hypothetical protein
MHQCKGLRFHFGESLKSAVGVRQSDSPRHPASLETVNLLLFIFDSSIATDSARLSKDCRKDLSRLRGEALKHELKCRREEMSWTAVYANYL